MKTRVILSLTLAAGGTGCGQRTEVAVTAVNTRTSVEQHPSRNEPPRSSQPTDPKEPPLHGGHGHAFANPVQQAKKWNDPERDRWQHPDEIVAALGLTPGATVADIGAGTGYMVAHMSRAVGAGGTVLAIDASTEMVEYLGGRTGELGPATVVTRKVGPDDPELPPAGVDAVLTLDTWHHVEKQEAYAKKVYDGLKRGGRFVVVDYEVGADVGPPKAMRLPPGQVAKQLEGAGFRAEVVRESMHRHYVVVGHKD